MENLEQVLDFHPSLIGSIAVTKTAVGAPIDTIGFGSVLALLVAGAMIGTGANAATLNVKIQESASLTGTGNNWSDIENGTVSGTFAFDELAWSDATDPKPLMGKKFEHISDGIRLRYIRAHATMAGTAGSSPKYSVGFLLAKPVDTVAYISSPVIQATLNSEYTVGR